MEFLRYEDLGGGYVATFEMGDFFEYYEYGPEFNDASGNIKRTMRTTATSKQSYSRSDLKEWIANAEKMGIDVSIQQRVLDNWPATPKN